MHYLSDFTVQFRNHPLKSYNTADDFTMSPLAILFCVLLSSTWLQSTQAREQSCGRVLSTTLDRQHIAHWPYRHLGQRCSWILNASQAYAYEIRLTAISRATVSVMAFSEGTQKQRILELNKNYVIPGRVLLITFAANTSMSAVQSGFELYYSPMISQSPDDLHVSANVLNATISQQSAVSKSLGSDSLSIFVQSPLSRDLNFQFYSLNLNLEQLNVTSRCCSDRVTVWTFDGATARWYLHATHCGHAEESRNVIYINRDIFMIVYEREAVREEQGIAFTFKDSLGEGRIVHTRQGGLLAEGSEIELVTAQGP